MEEALLNKNFDLFLQKLSILTPRTNENTIVSGFGKMNQVANKFEFKLYVKRTKVELV